MLVLAFGLSMLSPAPLLGACVPLASPAVRLSAGLALACPSLQSAVPISVAAPPGAAVGVSGWGWAVAGGLAVVGLLLCGLGFLGGALVGWILAYGFWQALMAQAKADRAYAQQQVGRMQRQHEVEMAERRRRMAASELPKGATEQAKQEADYYQSLAGIYPREVIDRLRQADDKGRHGALVAAGDGSSPEGT